MKKIGICQLSDSKYYEKRKNCVNSVIDYCNRKGYDYLGSAGTLDKSTHLCYQKPLKLLHHFNEYEYLGWLDMDTTIANRNFDLYNYLKNSEQDILHAKDLGGRALNSGVLFFRTNDFSLQVLNEWWESRYIGVDKPWRHGGNNEDQGRLVDILKKHSKLNPVNPHHFNIYPTLYNRGDFLIHFMGHHPLDYDRFVRFANEEISCDTELEYYWLVFSCQVWGAYQRSYEGNDKVNHSPIEIYKQAISLIANNIDFLPLRKTKIKL